MAFAVVEFAKANAVAKEMAVVPTCWIIKNEKRCYWPTKVKEPLAVFIQRSTLPNKYWPHYAIEKFI